MRHLNLGATVRRAHLDFSSGHIGSAKPDPDADDERAPPSSQAPSPHIGYPGSATAASAAEPDPAGQWRGS